MSNFVSGITRPRLVHPRTMSQDATGKWDGKTYSNPYWRMAIEFAPEGVKQPDIEYGNQLQFFLERLNDADNNFFTFDLEDFLSRIPTYDSVGVTVPVLQNYTVINGVRWATLNTWGPLFIGAYVQAGDYLLQIDGRNGDTSRQVTFRPALDIATSTRLMPASTIRLQLADRPTFQTFTTIVTEGNIDRRQTVEFIEYR